MAVSRDRVVLTTPMTRTTRKGWRIEKDVTIDLSTRKVHGYYSFYDTAGQFVESVEFFARISQARRDNLAADIEADIIAANPALAGIASVETVNDVDDPVVNP